MCGMARSSINVTWQIHMCHMARSCSFVCATRHFCTRDEGTGTRPDYLANRADKKMRGCLRKKMHGNREIVGDWAVVVWIYRDIWLRARIGAVLESNTYTYQIHTHIKYIHAEIAFAVMSIMSISLSFVPLGTKLLELPAQSPIGSCSTRRVTRLVHLHV